MHQHVHITRILDPRCCSKFKNKSSQATLVAFFYHNYKQLTYRNVLDGWLLSRRPALLSLLCAHGSGIWFKCRFKFSRTETKPGTLHLCKAPRRCGAGGSMDRTVSSEARGKPGSEWRCLLGTWNQLGYLETIAGFPGALA